MLNKNGIIIKLFFDMFLISIYDSYMCIYVYAYVYNESACTWLHICILMFPCYL